MSRFRLTVAAVAVAGLALAGCSSAGGRTASSTSASNGQAVATTMTVALITHSAPGDTFWDLVRAGAQDAAKKDGIKLEYSADPDGAAQANLVTAAVNRKVDGIAVTLAKPDQMASAVKAAVAAGIPVTALNGGVDSWKSLGVLGFFGQEDETAGEQTGLKLKDMGAKHVLCVEHEQGNVGNEARCAGVTKELPNTTKIYVKGTDMTDVQSKITAKLQADKSIDQVLTLNAGIAMTAIKAISQAGSSAKLATFDTNAQLVTAIKAGQVEFAVDQQPYLQGYLAIDALWLYKTNGDTIGGGLPVLTGPAFVDKSNVAAIATYAAAGKR